MCAVLFPPSMIDVEPLTRLLVFREREVLFQSLREDQRCIRDACWAPAWQLMRAIPVCPLSSLENMFTQRRIIVSSV